MTPFMIRVSEVLELATDVVLPDIRPSRPRPAAIGADEHVECRSLAEQLVCEANVVLSSIEHEPLSLTDDLRSESLSFTISCGNRQARIVTHIGTAVAIGNLYGIGARHLASVELAGADQLEELILLVIRADRADAHNSAVPAPGTLPQ